MKISDLFEADEQRLAKLKELLTTGKVPTIAHASYSAGNYALGDLRQLGYTEEIRERHGRTYDVWEMLTDKAKKEKIKFKMDGKLYGAGGLDRTEPVEVDYS